MESEIVDVYIEQALKFFSSTQIPLPANAAVHVYHHKGIQLIHQIGAMFINVVNHAYCKNFVIMLPGQSYPLHYHAVKTESIFVLKGDFTICLSGVNQPLQPGELIDIPQEAEHSFFTKTGAIFEEISSTYIPNDSIYVDKEIRDRSYEQRRTTLDSVKWKELVKQWNQYRDSI